MIDSYFFIPADKEKYLNKISEIDADNFVIDFEDAVSINNKTVAIENVRKMKINKNTYFRLPILEGHYNQDQMDFLVQKCEGRIVVPKVNSVEEMTEILTFIGGASLKLILLVETPKSYINIKDILSKYKGLIYGIGFGSHDFCSLLGMKHELELLKSFKIELNVIAKSFEVKFIDGVDIDLLNFENYQKECQFAFNIGADGKFMIYPKQVEIAHQLNYLTQSEIKEIESVYSHLKGMNIEDVDILKIDGKIYEKPHINRIVKLYNKLDKKK